MTVVTCDKCGAEDAKPVGLCLGHFPSRFHYGVEQGTHDAKMDLCKSCLAGLYDAIRKYIGLNSLLCDQEKEALL